MDSRSDAARSAALRAGLGFGALVVATYVLIVFGALVRANGAGLACPDWPLCHGQLVPTFDVKIAFEWGHRLLASFVSLGMLAGTVYVWRRPAVRQSVRAPLVLAWALLAVQVVLGGLTVLLGLAPWTVTAHLLVGNSLCAALLWIAMNLRAAGRETPRPRSNLTSLAGGLAFACAVLLVAQIALGGLVSSHYAGLACSSFPTCDGESIVPTLSGLVGIHVIHRLNAYLLVLGFGALVLATRRSGHAATIVRHGMHLVLFQMAVGILNVLTRLPVEVTALHSALATALVLLTLTLVREVLEARSVVAQAPSRTRGAMEAA